ncbi:acyl-CoA dehydrogenase family protein [Gordonia sp. zg691]|uniref:Acyl-CoA dehydrogenase family protein n=2 Tax=Gordonia jinghuaiqii TaxID=2758710 RepID=A0A7D7QHI4_9ACTN|nr:acyl-CoA dehydrogenase family protein [Gordonia jinghuaiqii]MBD0860484.1 acyl-CoA dehydrogenase family protein [Gordonia jinghuaiqii]MCR5978247.1 acyl-CoA dehydrogenase [Gordonia jinghuaiqii]QMT01304.1 acyl-CoA dehydrogenase family protein [Gordonia jinghuaiqii]
MTATDDLVDLDPGPAAHALRRRLRQLLAEMLPADWRTSFSNDAEVQAVVGRICRRLGDERLLTINWPAEFGGAGADVWQQTVLREEMWAHFEPRGAQYMGLSWVGPTLMQIGTPAQLEKHLPGIAEGRIVWCQGFSEPEAGTDLGSLKLSASRTDRGWLLTGQKIWTSYAGLADWCFLAARTSHTDNKHTGITIFLVPMSSPGITVRPIPSIMGEQHLNEVFFDGVEVAEEAILGELDQGWRVIKLVLTHERIGIPRYARDERILAALAGHESLQEPTVASDYARTLVHTRVARLLNHRAIALNDAGMLSDREASVARVASIHLDQEVAGLALDMVGSDGLVPRPGAGLLGQVEDIFRYARSATIASGTAEVQRMLIARSAIREVKDET